MRKPIAFILVLALILQVFPFSVFAEDLPERGDPGREVPGREEPGREEPPAEPSTDLMTPVIHDLKAEPFELTAGRYTSIKNMRLEPAYYDEYAGGEWGVSFYDDDGNFYATKGYVTSDSLPIPEDIKVSWIWAYLTTNYNTDGMVPVGMTKTEWNDRIEAYKTSFAAANGRQPEDSTYYVYSDDYMGLFASLDGWTEDPRMPVYSDEDICEGLEPVKTSVTAFGHTYSYRYFGAYVKVARVDGDGNEEILDVRRFGSGAAVQPKIVAITQTGSYYLQDIDRNPYTEDYDYSLTCDITYGPVELNYQWYETDGRTTGLDRTSIGTPIEGATGKTFVPDLSDGRTHYYYCAFSYTDSYGTPVSGYTKVAKATVARTLTFTVTDVPGGWYMGDGGEKNVDSPRFKYSHLNGDYSSLGDSFALIQSIGGDGVVSVTFNTYDGVAIRGLEYCDYFTYQWYKGTERGDKSELLGDEVTVSGFDKSAGTSEDAIAKLINVHTICPSDTVGTYWVTVVVTAHRVIGGVDYTYSAEDSNMVVTVEDNESLYTVDSDGTLTGYLGCESVMHIPASVGGIAVKKIGKLSVGNTLTDYDNPGPTKVIIPEGVEEIEEKAFSKISSLAEVVLPSTLKTIGDYAFYLCDIRSINFPEGLETIGAYAFQYGFAPGSSIEFPSTLTTIEAHAFTSSDLQQVVFNANVFPEVEDYAFYNCKHLEKVVLPSTVQGYLSGFDVFSKCSKLTVVENHENLLPEPGQSVVTYDDFAFDPCRILMQNDCLIDGEYVYTLNPDGSAVLKQYLGETPADWTIPTTLGGHNVVEISLMSDVTGNINQSELELVKDKTALHSVTFPASLVVIGNSVFAGYTALETVTFSGNNLRSVGMHAFEYCTQLSSAISFPASCCIHDNAFYGCIRLPRVGLGGVTVMADAFKYCVSLVSVTGAWIPGGYSSIDGAYAVSRSDLDYFGYVPAFPVNYSSTHKLDVDLETARQIAYEGSETAEYGKQSSGQPYYYFTTGNCVYAGPEDNATLLLYTGIDETEITVPAEIVNVALGKTFHICTIDENAFEFVGLDSVPSTWLGGIPAYNLEEKGVYATYTLTFSEGIQTINCKIRRATAVHFPDTVTSLAKDILSQKYSSNSILQEANIPAGVTSIPEYAFYHCTALESVAMHDNITSIGDYAFTGCTSYDADAGHLTFPSGLLQLGVRAFEDTAVTSFTVPAGIQSIAYRAFLSTDTVEILSLSSVYPVFEMDYAWYSESVGLIRCYGGSHTQKFAQSCGINYELLTSDGQRALELLDENWDPIPYSALESISWYDADGVLLGHGISVEHTDMSAECSCEVTFTIDTRMAYQAPESLTFVLEPGQVLYSLPLTRRENVTLTGTFADFRKSGFDGNFVIDSGFVQRRYSVLDYTNATTGKFEITLPKFPISLELSATGMRDYEQKDLQVFAVDGVANLGTVALQQCQKQYYLTYYEYPSTLVHRTFTYTVNNRTTGENLDAYTIIKDTNTLLFDESVWDHWAPEDEVVLTYDSAADLDKYEVKETVALPYEPTGINVFVTLRGYARLDMADGACASIFNSDGERLFTKTTLYANASYYLSDGEYTAVICKSTPKIREIPSVDYLERSGIPADCYIKRNFTITEGNETVVSGKPLPDMGIFGNIISSWSCSPEQAMNGYIPVFLKFDCTSDDCASFPARTIRIVVSGSNTISFMNNNGVYAYLRDADGEITAQSAQAGGGRRKPELIVETTATKGTLIFYFNPEAKSVDMEHYLSGFLGHDETETGIGTFHAPAPETEYSISELPAYSYSRDLRLTITPAIPRNSHVQVLANGTEIPVSTAKPVIGVNNTVILLTAPAGSAAEFEFRVCCENEEDDIELGSQSMIFPEVVMPEAEYVDVIIENPNAEEGLTHSECRIYVDGMAEGNLYLMVADWYMNVDNTLMQDVTYDFRMHISNSGLVNEGSVKLKVFYGENTLHGSKFVNLNYNPNTDTFDGTMVFGKGNYTISDLVYGVTPSFSFSVSDDMTYGLTANDPGVLRGLEDAYEYKSMLYERIEEDSHRMTPIDMDLVETFITYYSDGYPDYVKDYLRYEIMLYNIEAECLSDMYAAFGETAPDMIDLLGADHEGSLGDILDSASDGHCTQRTVEYSEAELAEQGFLPQTLPTGTCYSKVTGTEVRFYDPATHTETVCDFDSEGDLELMGSPSDPVEAALVKFQQSATHQNVETVTQLTDLITKAVTIIDDYLKLLSKQAVTLEAARSNVEVAIILDAPAADVSKKTNEFRAAFGDWLSSSFKEADLLAMHQEVSADLVKELNEKMAKTDKLMLELAETKKKLHDAAKKVKAGERFGYKFTTGLAKYASKAEAFLGPVGLLNDIIIVVVDLVDANADISLLKTKSKNAAISIATWYNAAVDAYSDACLEPGYDSHWFRPDTRRSQTEQMEICANKVISMFSWLTRRVDTAYINFKVVIAEDAAAIGVDVAALATKNPTVGLAGLAFAGVQNITKFTDIFIDWKIEKKIDSLYDEIYFECLRPAEKCKPLSGSGSGGGSGDDGGSEDEMPKIKTPHREIIDPAGYVYEAVASNRVEGATATIYYKGGDVVTWDADNYAQINPQVTDEEGRFQWFTPAGDWLVWVTKRGYQDGTSAYDPEAVDGWLPVPPPQTQVYIPLVSTAAPAVESVQAGENCVRIVFSQYMDIAALENNPELVSVMLGEDVVATAKTFADAEASPVNPAVLYGRILELSPADADFFEEGISLVIDESFVNYAGTPIGSDYVTESLEFVQLPGSIEHSYPNRFVTEVSDESEIVVSLKDTCGLPIAGAEVTASFAYGGSIVLEDCVVVTDKDGRAEFVATGNSSGYDEIIFSAGTVTRRMNTYVNPIGTEAPAKPTANLEDFAVVESGTWLELDCITSGAAIRFTLNDTCPCSEDALVYSGPIEITENTFIRIAAWTEEGGYSERLNLHLMVKPSVDALIQTVTTGASDDTMNVSVALHSEDLGWKYDILAGLYDEHGRMLAITSKSVVFTEKDEQLHFELPVNSDMAEIRIFCITKENEPVSVGTAYIFE